ncbi:hypothetical protein B0T25DRAFT_516847 [Lasiosphaeria hispida]|uniref:Uncharacterized protein n=1 Tax=Lasiosphaeria hispida TaxID=260671 RepID=A0AAJ0HMD7_9PEZI|nr:hypothetical protein B0T25DRAFT_516847 [Lasiosphaeria hispida]
MPASGVSGYFGSVALGSNFVVMASARRAAPRMTSVSQLANHNRVRRAPAAADRVCSSCPPAAATRASRPASEGPRSFQIPLPETGILRTPMSNNLRFLYTLLPRDRPFCIS